MKKKIFPILLILGVTVLLAGCTDFRTPLTPEDTGIWVDYFVRPMSKFILFFADLLNSNGLAIVVVTIIIRTVLVPLYVKQLKSSMAMQAIQPEMKELQKKYSSKDQKTQQKLQQETMALFQKHKVNPLAGCLPIFVQMPILIAIYHAIMRTSELQGDTFLWFALSEPDYILPFIAGGATFLQQKLMMSGAGSASMQNAQMKAMLYLMPIMITVFAFMFPSALALYWVVGNIFMVLQTIAIRKPIMKDSDTGGESK